eukprot:5303859-Pyramimonas_sp.AAC.1
MLRGQTAHAGQAERRAAAVGDHGCAEAHRLEEPSPSHYARDPRAARARAASDRRGRWHREAVPHGVGTASGLPGE